MEKKYEVNIIEPKKSINTKFVVTQHETKDLVRVVFNAMPIRDQKRNVERDHHDITRDLYPSVKREDIRKHKDGGIVLGGGRVVYQNNEFELSGRSTDFGHTPKEDLVNLGPLVLKAYHENMPEITKLHLYDEFQRLFKVFDISEESFKPVRVLLNNEDIKSTLSQITKGLALAYQNYSELTEITQMNLPNKEDLITVGIFNFNEVIHIAWFKKRNIF